MLALIQVGIGFAVPPFVPGWSPASPGGRLIALVFLAFGVAPLVLPRVRWLWPNGPGSDWPFSGHAGRSWMEVHRPGGRA